MRLSVRLAVWLTGLYLVALCIYSVVVWRTWTAESIDVGSPLLYREGVKPDGERERLLPAVRYKVDAFTRIEGRFDSLVFFTALLGGTAAIWLFVPGVAWLIRGPLPETPRSGEPFSGPFPR